MDKDLERRIHKLDEPAFHLANQVRTDLIEVPYKVAASFGLEQISENNRSQNLIASARLKKKMSDAMDTISGLVVKNLDYQKQLKLETEKAEKSIRKSVSDIAHDLRTPLTMIKGYGEVMRDLPDENTPENVQVIIDETQRLSNLVNDLLDLSKLQAGTRKLTLSRFSLTELTRSVMTRYEKLTQKDGYRIEYAFDLASSKSNLSSNFAQSSSFKPSDTECAARCSASFFESPAP